MLLANGANVNLANTDEGSTPLSVASYKGHVEVVRLLLANGANVDQTAVGGESPLLAASVNGNEACLKTLLHYGADLDLRATDYIEFEDGFEILSGQSPLEVAVAQGHAGCAEILRKWPATANQLTAKLCLERMRREGMHAVVEATNTSELTRPMFVFKVLDMFMNCMMQPQGEKVVEYVGLNIGL